MSFTHIHYISWGIFSIYSGICHLHFNLSKFYSHFYSSLQFPYQALWPYSPSPLMPSFPPTLCPTPYLKPIKSNFVWPSTGVWLTYQKSPDTTCQQLSVPPPLPGPGSGLDWLASLAHAVMITPSSGVQLLCWLRKPRSLVTVRIWLSLCPPPLPWFLSRGKRSTTHFTTNVSESSPMQNLCPVSFSFLFRLLLSLHMLQTQQHIAVIISSQTFMSSVEAMRRRGKTMLLEFAMLAFLVYHLLISSR